MSKIKSSILYVSDINRSWCFATIVLLSIVTTIAGCGYRLSGISDDEQLFSPLMKTISIEGIPRYDAFNIQLKNDASLYRISVTTAESATTRIIVKNKDIKQYAIIIGDDAKVREYLLTAKLDFSVIVDGNEYAAQSIQSEATYTYYPQHVSISLNEKKRALAFLNKDLSTKLINQLRSLTNRI
ncbi:MAG: hypothetical protein GDA45_02725 [Chromatiales bacterium]|nr:hypothetical protein [Chromatiales bacterium]